VRLVNDYLLLRKSFPHIQSNQPFHVSMEQLANALFCSQRNVKFILIKMTDLQWVVFSSGRGRGHKSQMTFLIHPDELVLESAKERVQNGDVESALSLIGEQGIGMQAKGEFLTWISQYFGYQAVNLPERYIETLKLPIYRTINTLDPCKTFYALDSHLISQIFSRVVEYNDEAGSFEGGIAHHWKVNHEHTDWVFYLRKSVYFHHGKELEASDVIYSFHRLQNTPHNWLVQNIKRVSILSRYSIRIELKQTNHLFLSYLSHVPMSIVPADLYQPLAESEPDLPVGSGPYRVATWTKGFCSLEAFDHYYHLRPHIDRVEITVVPAGEDEIFTDTLHQILRVQTGESMTPQQEEWESEGEVCGTNLLTVNVRKDGLLQNHVLRKALIHLIDRCRMADDLGLPRFGPCRSFDLNQAQSHSNDSLYQLNLGQTLLQESGYRGETIQLYTYQRHAPDAYWLQREYGKHGINIHVHIVSWSDMLRIENIQFADLILFEAVVSEGLIRLLEYYQSSNSFLKMHLSEEMTEDVERQIEELLKQSEPTQREHRLQAIEQQLTDANALIFLTYKTVSSKSHPSLQNVKLSPRGWVDFHRIWYETNEEQ
jgi:SgrR family transcriptional regulator